MINRTGNVVALGNEVRVSVRDRPLSHRSNGFQIETFAREMLRLCRRVTENPGPHPRYDVNINEARQYRWPCVVTLALEGSDERASAWLLDEICETARACRLVVAQPPADRRSWRRLERALEEGALFVVIEKVEDLPPPLLAVLTWLLVRYRERPIAWLAGFRGDPPTGSAAAEIYRATDLRSTFHFSPVGLGVADRARRFE